ncbi:hypothetical protein [Pseudomonas sp. Pc102]|uniref:hypothetical protein n=1 Tax=Pseudomonas sp. Pc102 TaxID=2678261 RepID=UPI0032AFC6D4
MANEDLAELQPMERLLFIYLWMLADREGRLEDRPKRIKAEAFPYDDAHVDDMLDNLQSAGFIIRYAVDGKRFIQVHNFTKHQRPHNNETASDIPPMEQGLTPSEKPEIEPVQSDSNQGEQDFQPREEALRSDLLIPDSLIPDSGLSAEPSSPAVVDLADHEHRRKPRKPVDTECQEACRAVWNAYADAYHGKYGVEPLRNAKVNGQVKQLVARIPRAEAPSVAAYYLTLNDQFYTRGMHEFGLLLSRAEAIRTQWATGRQMTATRAQQIDLSQSNRSTADEALEILRQQGRFA